ncbi:hypothetical protein [Dactylosporangium sp. CA-092794]|uniref:hypothetical protein n=1 Tax=Dactylosporangium sp. CA-092794 TaxID=3239929 RepID=UPI003D8ADE80
MLQDLAAITESASSFGSALNDYAFEGNKTAQRAIDITNMVTSLGGAAAHGWDVAHGDKQLHPYYVAASVASAALSTARTAVGIAMDEGTSKETAKFAIDMAQAAMQVAKWGTKPSEKKGKGKDYDAVASEVSSLRAQTQSLQSQVDSASRIVGTSTASVHSSQSAPVAGASGQRHRSNHQSSGQGRRRSA